MSEGARSSKSNVWRYVSAAVSLLIVVGIFVYAIPKFADYAQVWKAITTLTPIEMGTLIAATIFNLFTYWWANMAALPGLRLWPAAVVTQTTTSVANTLPGGGAIAIGLTYSILHSWGFSGTAVALYVGVSGIWNIFMKLALPVLSVVFLVISGKKSAAFISAALIGLVVLAAAVVLLAAIFKSEALARRVGNGIAHVLSAIRRVFRKPPVTGMDERAAKFRADTIDLVSRRWIRLTWTTLLSQLALFLILLLSLAPPRGVRAGGQHGRGVRRLLVRAVDLGAPDHARRTRCDRTWLHRRVWSGRAGTRPPSSPPSCCSAPSRSGSRSRSAGSRT